MTATLPRFALQCLQLVASGYSHAEVARHLDADPAAVRMALEEAQHYLSTENDVHSVAVAITRGLIR